VFPLIAELRDKRNLAALHYGCQVGNTDTVTVLLNAGAEVNARGFAGTTPLHIAVSTCWLLAVLHTAIGQVITFTLTRVLLHSLYMVISRLIPSRTIIP